MSNGPSFEPSESRDPLIRVARIEGYLPAREAWSDGMADRVVRVEERVADHDRSLNSAWAEIGKIKVRWSMAAILSSAIGGIISGVLVLIVADWLLKR